MAKFYVGQRVRIKRAHRDKQHLIGTETTLLGHFTDTDGEKQWRTNIASPSGDYFYGPEDCFEPLIKPDNEVGSWKKLGWHPSEFLAKNPSEFTQQKEKIA